MAILPTRPTNSSQNLVYDIATLGWVKMTQPLISTDTVNINLPDEGQQTMANSISVTVASNQTPIIITGAVITL